MIIWCSRLKSVETRVRESFSLMKLSLHTREIPKESCVIVGVSGGRDSMALVHALRAQRPDLYIIAAHVNHGLRANSDEDAEFTRGMMQRWEIPVEVLRPRAPETGNLEEWGRDKRYEFFEKLRKKYKAAGILTAHHQDDDFESMLLHTLRGTRVKGLSGMLPKRGSLIRPLLFTPRSDINSYVEALQIPYRDDPTNEDDSFTRNFLRLKIIPVLNHVYPGLAERWQNHKKYWLELQTLLEGSARAFMEEFLDQKEGLLRRAYQELPYPIRITVLELWYQDSTGKRVMDNATLDRWDDAVLHFETRKKTEWDPTAKKAKFLVLSKERAKLA